MTYLIFLIVLYSIVNNISFNFKYKTKDEKIFFQIKKFKSKTQDIELINKLFDKILNLLKNN